MKQKIDPESLKFINWVNEKLADPEFIIYLRSCIETRFFQFMSTPIRDIKPLLDDKLNKGALDHGAPIYSNAECEVELTQELIDLYGWELVRLFNRDKEKWKTKTTKTT